MRLAEIRVVEVQVRGREGGVVAAPEPAGLRPSAHVSRDVLGLMLRAYAVF
jgi:hypothetical protein